MHANAFVKGDLAETVAVFLYRDMLWVSGDGGVVGAEEDGHEPDVRDMMAGRDGREEMGQR